MRNLLFLIFLSFLISCKPEIKKENRIQEDVTYLASDELEGRQTGTSGEKKAAKYIQKELKVFYNLLLLCQRRIRMEK